MTKAPKATPIPYPITARVKTPAKGEKTINPPSIFLNILIFRMGFLLHIGFPLFN